MKTQPPDTRAKALAAACLLLIGLSGCAAPKESKPLTNLAGGIGPLESAFNNDAGKVRLLLLLDPT